MRKRGLVPLLLVGLIGATTGGALLLHAVQASHFPVDQSQADRELAVTLKRLLREEGARSLFRGSRTRDAVRDFYSSRTFAPLWTEGGGPSARYGLARDYLQSVGDEGLQAADYVLPVMSGDAAALARRELIATRTVLRYAQDANSGRVDPARIAREIAYPERTLNVAAFLDRIADEQHVAAALKSLHPVHPHYKALKHALAELRSSGQPTDGVIANMERWRWLPREFSANRMIVNIPDATVRFVHNGELVFVARAVVGKLTTPTPLIAATITSLTFNPVWNVPPSMAGEDAMIALARNPDLREQTGFSLAAGPDGSARLVHQPGVTNPLGRVRFNLPNSFAIYLHDTPERFLFEQTNRAFSHGCVRTENALSLAAKVLSVEQGGTNGAPDLRSLMAQDNVEVPLAASLPIYFVYETLLSDEGGAWRRAADLYAYDAILIELLRARRIERETAVLASMAPAQPQHFVTRLYGRLMKRIQAIAAVKAVLATLS
jgi:murein L,D-transpeptidase YcbB/YkuD